MRQAKARTACGQCGPSSVVECERYSWRESVAMHGSERPRPPLSSPLNCDALACRSCVVTVTLAFWWRHWREEKKRREQDSAESRRRGLVHASESMHIESTRIEARRDAKLWLGLHFFLLIHFMPILLLHHEENFAPGAAKTGPMWGNNHFVAPVFGWLCIGRGT